MGKYFFIFVLVAASIIPFNFARAWQPIHPRGFPAGVADVSAIQMPKVAGDSLSVPVVENDPNAISPDQAAATPPAATPTPTPKPTPLPSPTPAPPPSDKVIVVSLKDQQLTYFEGTTVVGQFKISSGLPGTPTPPGEYTVLIKKPVVDYKGPNYDFKNTKWNLMFKKGNPLNYYIHGAYWHHNFGHPMSHGCINVSYANMEPLYNWADVGTRIIIQ